MPILSHPAFGPKAALVYVTLGCLLDVWVAVWYFAFGRNEDEPLSSVTQFWLLGLFLTGLTFLVIGLLLGRIGRAARQAELPPSEAMPAEANIQKTAAANPNGVAVTGPAAMPGAVPHQPYLAPGTPVAPPAGVR